MAEELNLRLERPVAAVTLLEAASPGSVSAATTSAERLRPAATRSAGQAGPTQRDMENELAQLGQARTALKKALAELDRLRADVLAQAEQDLVDLSLEIARKVLAQEIQAERYQIDPIVREALSQAPSGQEAIVRLNPADFARIEQAKGEDEQEGAGNIRFLADPAVARASARVETAEGTVESNVESKLDDIGEVLREAR